MNRPSMRSGFKCARVVYLCVVGLDDTPYVLSFVRTQDMVLRRQVHIVRSCESPPWATDGGRRCPNSWSLTCDAIRRTHLQRRRAKPSQGLFRRTQKSHVFFQDPVVVVDDIISDLAVMWERARFFAGVLCTAVREACCCLFAYSHTWGRWRDDGQSRKHTDEFRTVGGITSVRVRLLNIELFTNACLDFSLHVLEAQSFTKILIFWSRFSWQYSAT